MTALDDLNRWAAILEQARKTLVCPPQHEDAIREAVDLSGVGGFYDVRASDACPPGAVFIVKGQRP